MKRGELIEAWDVRARDLLKQYFPNGDHPWELPDALVHAFEEVHNTALHIGHTSTFCDECGHDPCQCEPE